MANWLDELERQKQENERIAKQKQEEANRQYNIEQAEKERKRQLSSAFSSNLQKTSFFNLCERLKKLGKPIDYSLGKLDMFGMIGKYGDKVRDSKGWVYEEYDEEGGWGHFRDENASIARRYLLIQVLQQNNTGTFDIKIDCILFQKFTTTRGYKDPNTREIEFESNRTESDESRIVLSTNCDSNQFLTLGDNYFLELLGWLVGENDEPRKGFSWEYEKLLQQQQIEAGIRSARENREKESKRSDEYQNYLNIGFIVLGIVSLVYYFAISNSLYFVEDDSDNLVLGEEATTYFIVGILAISGIGIWVSNKLNAINLKNVLFFGCLVIDLFVFPSFINSQYIQKKSVIKLDNSLFIRTKTFAYEINDSKKVNFLSRNKPVTEEVKAGSCTITFRSGGDFRTINFSDVIDALPGKVIKYSTSNMSKPN